MDRGHGSQRGIPRLSRLPLARGSSPQTYVHQDDPPKQSLANKASIPHLRKPSSVKPLSEGGNPSIKPGFSSHTRILSVTKSPTCESPDYAEFTSLDTTPPNTKADCAIINDDDENESTVTEKLVKPEKRRPRPSLSERTVETLASIPSSPSPTRKRSSTINSTGSMGPPARPASSTSSRTHDALLKLTATRPQSPTKRPFRPPGRPTSPAKDAYQNNSFGPIYTPPRALMRDQTSRIGRPLRDNRRSISNAMTFTSEGKPTHLRKPSNQAVKVKSMYDLRAAAAASRNLNAKPSLPTLIKDPVTPKTEKILQRTPPFRETSPQASLLKARQIGENVLATAPSKIAKVTTKPTQNIKMTKRSPAPNESRKREPSLDAGSKTSASLRETIAKAKAARKDETRRTSNVNEPVVLGESQPDLFISMGSQSMQKKIDNAVTSGVLNLSALALRNMPREVLTMYDFKEDSIISWSEAVDLTKLIMADNELEEVTEEVFPDWTKEEMLSDVEKSNLFGGLEILDLHGNCLRNLPLGIRRLERLSILKLNSNDLNLGTFSIISQIPNLRELYIAKNGLSGTLPNQIAAMTNLHVLDLGDNQLDDLPESFSNLMGLQKLSLGGNRLRDFRFANLGLQNLMELDLSRNMLSDTFQIDGIKSFSKLTLLDVSNNSLNEFSLDSLELPNLHTLAVQNNRLRMLPDLSSCPELITLTASDNKLDILPPSFYSLAKIMHADFSGNNIKHLEIGVSSMESLVALNISSNPLRQKKYLSMSVDEIRCDLAQRAADNIPIVSGPQLTGVSTTMIQSIPENEVMGSQLYMPKAGVLDLSSHNLFTLHPSEVDLSNPIHTIRLSNNDFTKFPAELLLHPSVKWSLRSLDMSHNPSLHPVQYLSQNIELPLLQSLYIVSTGLTTLDTLTALMKAPELKELNISCHRMAGHIPWVRAWYPSITILLASDNWFDSIDVEAVRGLEVLDVRNNEIESLPPKIGLLGNHSNKFEAGRLRSFECSGNRFRVPRITVVEKGSEAILRDLRRMVSIEDVPEEWVGEV